MKNMLDSNHLSVNDAGHLVINGVDTVDLAKEYKTPFYVMDEELIRQNCRIFKKSIDMHYNSEGMVCYASKAFCCKAICRIIKAEGLGLDVVSGGELYTALSVDFPTDRICFHGNNKTEEELTLAVSHGVGRIVVDNFAELDRLNTLAGKLHKKASILLRIKPGIDAHTHEFIRTGQIDSKFGFALETGEAINAVKKAITMENIRLRGVHCHIGSQIFDVDPFVLAAKVMMEFICQVYREENYILEDLNLGGGFGIQYTSEDNPISYDSYMMPVAAVIREFCKNNDMKPPFIMIEPGRAIVGPAGITLYTVGTMKEIPNMRTYLSVNGGMGDNPRYILYQAKYDMEIANKASEKKTEIYTVAGKYCESGDLLGENILLQPAEEGDLLAVLTTGAYNYSMASNYNRIPRLPVVMVNNGKSKLIIKRESMEDIIRNDL